MIPSDFFIEVGDFQRDRQALQMLRETVFQIEQKVPEDLLFDELDAKSRHVLARDLNGNPIGVGRLTPRQTIGRMAVLSRWRGKGVGTALLNNLIDLAKTLRYPKVELHSQVHAVPFYARFGFVPDGAEYAEAGLPHQSMRLDLQATTPGPPPPPISRDSAEVELHSLEATGAALRELLNAARHQLWIYSRELEPQLFAGESILAEVRRVATSGRGAEIRVLLQDSVAAVRDKAGLIGLAQRLSSVLQLRRVVEEVDLHYPGAFVLNDVGGFLLRPIGSRFEGVFVAHAAGRHRQLHDYFNEVWERAVPASELRAGVV